MHIECAAACKSACERACVRELCPAPKLFGEYNTSHLIWYCIIVRSAAHATLRAIQWKCSAATIMHLTMAHSSDFNSKMLIAIATGWWEKPPNMARAYIVPSCCTQNLQSPSPAKHTNQQQKRITSIASRAGGGTNVESLPPELSVHICI